MNTAPFAIPAIEKVREKLGDNWHEFLVVTRTSPSCFATEPPFQRRKNRPVTPTSG